MSAPVFLGIKYQLILVEACGHQVGCEFDEKDEVPPATGAEYKSASRQLDALAEKLAGVFGLTSWEGVAEASCAAEIVTLSSAMQDAAPIDVGMFHVVATQALRILTARREFHAIHDRLLAASLQVRELEAAGQLTAAQALESAVAAQAEADRAATQGTLVTTTAASTAQVANLTAALDGLADRVGVTSGPGSSSGAWVSVEPAGLTRIASVLGSYSVELKVPSIVGPRVLEEVWATHGRGVTDAFKQGLAEHTSARTTLLERIKEKMTARAASLTRTATLYQNSDQAAALAVTR